MFISPSIWQGWNFPRVVSPEHFLSAGLRVISNLHSALTPINRETGYSNVVHCQCTRGSSGRLYSPLWPPPHCISQKFYLNAFQKSVPAIICWGELSLQEKLFTLWSKSKNSCSYIPNRKTPKAMEWT